MVITILKRSSSWRCFQWQQSSCPILYFVIEYKLANELEWTIGDPPRQYQTSNHRFDKKWNNGMKAEKVIVITLFSDKQPASARCLQHKRPPASNLLWPQGMRRIMMTITKIPRSSQHYHRHHSRHDDYHQVTAHNHAGSRSAAYQFSTLTPLGSPARSTSYPSPLIFFTTLTYTSHLQGTWWSCKCPLWPWVEVAWVEWFPVDGDVDSDVDGDVDGDVAGRLCQSPSLFSAYSSHHSASASALERVSGSLLKYSRDKSFP